VYLRTDDGRNNSPASHRTLTLPLGGAGLCSRNSVRPFDFVEREIPTGRPLVTCIRGNKADRLGIARAPDAKSAIKFAIREFKITDPEERKRIAAMPDA